MHIFTQANDRFASDVTFADFDSLIELDNSHRSWLNLVRLNTTLRDNSTVVTIATPDSAKNPFLWVAIFGPDY